jgi:hypothetical protein
LFRVYLLNNNAIGQVGINRRAALKKRVALATVSVVFFGFVLVTLLWALGIL